MTLEQFLLALQKTKRRSCGLAMKRPTKPKVARLWMVRDECESSSEVALCTQESTKYGPLYHVPFPSIAFTAEECEAMFGFLPAPGSCVRARVTLEVET